jgi:hypothetical protein
VFCIFVPAYVTVETFIYIDSTVWLCLRMTSSMLAVIPFFVLYDNTSVWLHLTFTYLVNSHAFDVARVILVSLNLILNIFLLLVLISLAPRHICCVKKTVAQYFADLTVNRVSHDSSSCPSHPYVLASAFTQRLVEVLFGLLDFSQNVRFGTQPESSAILCHHQQSAVAVA